MEFLLWLLIYTGISAVAFLTLLVAADCILSASWFDKPVLTTVMIPKEARKIVSNKKGKSIGKAKKNRRNRKQ